MTEVTEFKQGDKVRRKDGDEFSDGKYESEVTRVESRLQGVGHKIYLTTGHWINPEALVLANMFEPPWDEAPDWAEAYILDKGEDAPRSGWYLKKGSYWINPTDSRDSWEVQPTAYKTVYPRYVPVDLEPTPTAFIPEVGTVCLYNNSEHGWMKTRIIAHHPDRPTAWHEAVDGEFGDGTNHSVDDFAFFRPPFTEEELAAQKAEQERQVMIKQILEFLGTCRMATIDYTAEGVYTKFVEPLLPNQKGTTP